mgnify:CR=1 FL=1
MRPRTSVFIATSLDGFIARPDGAIDWLDEANETITPGEDCGFAEFFATVDTLVMGRGTFESVLHLPQWFYGDKPLVVLSQSLTSLPEEAPASVSLSSEGIEPLLERLASLGRKHLYIDGGKTIQSFLRAGLIDELTITRIPVLLGRGLPLFGDIESDVRLRLISSKSWDFGFVQDHYRVV